MFNSASGEDVMYYYADLREISIDENEAIAYYKEFIGRSKLENSQVTKLAELQNTTGEFQSLIIPDIVTKNKRFIVITQYIRSKH